MVKWFRSKTSHSVFSPFSAFLLLLAGSLIIALVTGVRSQAAPAQQTSCTPVTLSIYSSTPDSWTDGSWITNSRSAVWNDDGYVQFDLDLLAERDNEYLGAALTAGRVAGAYLSASFGAADYTLWVKVVEASAYEDVDADTLVLGLTDEEAFTPGIYTKDFTGGATPPNWGNFYFDIVTANYGGVDQVSLSGRWLVAVTEQGCPNPFDSTEVPGGRPGCEGIELLGDYHVVIEPGETWQGVEPSEYNDMRAQYWFYVPDDNGVPVLVSLNAYTETGEILTGGEGYFSWELWEPVGGPTGTLTIENQGDENIYLISACLMEDILDNPLCINSDSDLHDPLRWHTDASVYWDSDNGLVYLDNGEQIDRMLHITSGEYTLWVKAKSMGSTGGMLVIAMGSEVHTLTGEWAFYTQDFTMSAEGDVQIGVIGYGSETAVIDEICLQRTVAADTPTPQPTPTAPSGCYNADPYMTDPDTWTLNGSTLSSGLLTLPPGSNAIHDFIDLVPGIYRLSMRVKSCQNGNTFQVDIGDPYSGMGSVFQTVPYGDCAWNVYTPGDFELLEDYEMTLTALGSNYGNIEINHICLTQLSQSTPTPTPVPTGTPNPTGTSTATATATATSTPIHTATPTMSPGGGDDGGDDDNSGGNACVNNDPGLDDSDEWSTSGGASIAGGVGTLTSANDSIYTFVETDPMENYYVYVVGRSTGTNAEVQMQWRGNVQIFQLAGDSAWKMPGLYFPAADISEQQLLADPLSGLSMRQSDNADYVSPIETPVAMWQVSPLYLPSWYAVGAARVLEITLLSGGPVEIESVCVVPEYNQPGPGDSGEEVLSVWHPVCDRDYIVQAGYVSPFYEAMRIGPDASAGMPVHAILDGYAYSWGSETSLLVGEDIYKGCVYINHSAKLNHLVESVTCGCSQFNIPSSWMVTRGQTICWAGETSDDESNKTIVFQLSIDDAIVDPTDWFADDGYPDCYPYRVNIEQLDTCDADDGSGLIPARFNVPFPWESLSFGDLLRWVTTRIYDIVGYPILCVLVSLFNSLVLFFTTVANVFITAVTPALVFLYRISKVLNYVIIRLGDIFAEMYAMFGSLVDMMGCGKTIIEYFTMALKEASSANTEIDRLAAGDITAAAVGIALKLIESTIANIVLLPMTVILIGFSAWKLIPWGLREIRQATGIGGDN